MHCRWSSRAFDHAVGRRMDNTQRVSTRSNLKQSRPSVLSQPRPQSPTNSTHAPRQVREHFRIPTNTQSDALVGAEDMFMTLCDLAKVQVNQQEQAVDSISFARVLVDGYKFSPRYWLYTAMEAPNRQNKALGKQHAIRKGSLKLISLQESVGGSFHMELYDLSTDLKEERNLISDKQYRKDVAVMLKRLDEYGGPNTRPNAPSCNLKYCGSAQMLIDEGIRKSKIPTSTTTVSSCPDQNTWATTTTNAQSKSTNAIPTGSPSIPAHPVRTPAGDDHAPVLIALETSHI